MIVLDLDEHQGGSDSALRILADRDVPIIALSDDPDRRQPSDTTGVTHLRKPYAAPDLVDAIRDAVSQADQAVRQERRAESLAALKEITQALGYPPAWAHELEQRAFADGKVWRRVEPLAR